MRGSSLIQRSIPSLPESRFDFLLFDGGLDQQTPGWQVKPGTLRDCQNYERAIQGGYRDIAGYERYDGRPRPSDADYAVLDVTITGSIEVGDTITGVTSGATGYVVLVDTSAAQAFLVITKITGTFDESNETLNVSGSPEGNTDATAAISGAASALLHAQYLNLAADAYRTDIAVVPGEGDVLGVFMLAGTKYAWRNATGGATAKLYKNHASTGWTEVNLGRTVAFTSGGVTEIEAGDTITGATSAATAIVGRVVLTSGTWAGGDAAGTFHLHTQTGTFQAENLNVGASLNLATIAGNSTATTMSPSGRFEVVRGNLTGAGGSTKAYGVDGVNACWEFDGTFFTKIATGMTADTPLHVAIHKHHLFLSFGSSVQHSALGDPYSWSLILGAAEIATADSVTGFSVEPGSAGDAALAIWNRNKIYVLYGNDTSDWNLVPYRDEVGAIPYTIQQLAYTMVLDDRGITSLRTAQEFGNFQHATLSGQIQSLIQSKRSVAVASCIARDKNQYRLFFSDNSGLYVTMDGTKVKGMMPVLFDHDVTCICSDESSTGDEEIYFGSSDGYVYQLDKGTSFDGASIAAYLYFHFHYAGMNGWLKRWISAVLEASGTGYASFDFSFDLNYANSQETAQPQAETYTLPFSSVRWDAFVWDQFIWDGATLGPTRARLAGEAENISLIIRKDSDYFSPVLLTGARIRYIPRRQVR